MTGACLSSKEDRVVLYAIKREPSLMSSGRQSASNVLQIKFRHVSVSCFFISSAD